MSFFDFIHIDEYSSTPKYLQLSNAVINAIELGHFKPNVVLPSINELCYKLDMARDTVDKGYRHLKSIGVIISVPGKGFYVSNVEPQERLKIFLLFNKLSAHKKIIYDSFIDTLGKHVYVDFYIYHNDFSLFKTFLTERKIEIYSHFVIIPHFIEGKEFVKDVISTIPKEKLILLDKIIPQVEGNYGAVYENFEKDIYDALEEALADLSKYHTLKIVFPPKSYFPTEILEGFHNFCQQYAFSPEVVHHIEIEPINKGEVFIVLMEDDLVTLLERTINMDYTIGADIGVISYNETPLKKILLNGITTISTDFTFMGKAAANAILQKTGGNIEVPFKYTKRNSL